MTIEGNELELIATAGFGVEAVVARELRQLGYEGAKSSEPGRVRFRAGAEAIARCNLQLRSADRLLIELTRFEATDFGQLFDHTKELSWERWIPSDGLIHVRGRSHRSQLHGVPACQRLVKKAIVDRLMTAHRVASLPETGPKFPVEVSLLDDQASLTLDTSGRALHRRGYRPITGAAPLKETLAAALVQLTFWNIERPFLDPFCGTGTLAIEAAMLARRIAPGSKRDFIAESWPGLDPGIWPEAREEARDLELAKLPIQIVGADLSAGAVETAAFHARQAGVAQDIRFIERAFDKTPRDDEFGCLVTNPPYGHRLEGGPGGESSSTTNTNSPSPSTELLALYASMPSVLAKLANWSHYILVADRNFEALVDRQADRRRKLYAGRIECTYYQFHGPHPKRTQPSIEQPHRAAFAAADDTTTRQVEQFATRVAKRARHLRKWSEKRATNCYRLYERDIKEIPLIVDRFADALHITEIVYAKDRSAAAQASWREAMLESASEILAVPRKDIHFKQKHRHGEGTQPERLANKNIVTIVQENGLDFEVNLSDYVDTGLFMDHRKTRERIRSEARGCRFLNLFAYTGSFTVCAANGGADSTTSVDRSHHYLEWAQRNLALNGMTHGGAHRFVAMDCQEYLRLPLTERFDLAVVDPPTFSNRKGREDWIVQEQHRDLLGGVFELMSPGGVVYFSTNFRKFQLETKGLPVAAIDELTPHSIPEDFRNRRIHRCWRMELAER